MRWLLALILFTTPLAAEPVPRLVDHHGARQLQVDGKPWLILGGELANSSASSRAYMADRWPRLAAMGLNTVLVPVTWEQVEPIEGRFDFALLDGLLADARRAKLRVVLLWFGSWKNSMSSYAPAWVKRDDRRFPRARTADGRALEMLSAFAPANAAADARAFAALMAHLARIDAVRTVIMVQVENEVGMIPESRDRSPAGDAAWIAPVPAALGGGRWAARGDEVFMAWHFARYVERVAAAGRAAYSLPLFANAALPRPGAKPGSGYPAAGPLPHLADIWRKGASSIDFLAPDIYFPNFAQWARAYATPGNPLFVPEAGQAGDGAAAANALLAIGALDAIGFSPFSIDTIGEEGGREVRALYATLSSLSSMILERQGTPELWAAAPPVAFDGTADLAPQSSDIGGHRVTLSFVDPWTPRDRQRLTGHGAIVLRLGPDELLIAGRGVTATFAAADGPGKVGIESIWEGSYEDGRWTPGRLLNGDQSHQGRHVRLPPDAFGVQRVRLYRYR